MSSEGDARFGGHQDEPPSRQLRVKGRRGRQADSTAGQPPAPEIIVRPGTYAFVPQAVIPGLSPRGSAVVARQSSDKLGKCTLFSLDVDPVAVLFADDVVGHRSIGALCPGCPID